jgi:hypothetical protein
VRLMCVRVCWRPAATNGTDQLPRHRLLPNTHLHKTLGSTNPARQPHLWVCRLRHHARDGVGVPAEREHLHLGAHVPHAAGGVAAASHDEVQGRVQRQAVHARQVPVVVADHLQAGERQGESRSQERGWGS